MRSIALSDRDRRAVRIGVLAIAMMLVLTRGFPAIRSWNAERQQSAIELATQAAALRNSLAVLGERKDSLGAHRQLLERMGVSAIAHGSVSAATAALAERVGDLADTANVMMGALQLTADTSRNPTYFFPVHARFDGETDIRGLSKFLTLLERGRALIIVRSLSVTPLDLAATYETAERLRVEMLVEAIGSAHPCSCAVVGCDCQAAGVGSE